MTITLSDIQSHVGTSPDGVWGPATATAIGNALGMVPEPADKPFQGQLTVRMLQELVGHEAIVREAYKDSVGVWTWGVGVTSRSGYSVDQYKDKPQSIEHCLKIFAWLVMEKYAPAVRKAFAGRALTEEQFAAALSFHYNTGAISRASWVKSWMAGKPTQARKEFMNWTKPPEITDRRKAERDLFFAGTWTSDGKATVYPVRKPSYSPNWGGAQRVDITADLERALA